MTFATEKIKPGSQKITLLEIDLPYIVMNIYNYTSGIWVVVLDDRFGSSGTITQTDDDGAVGYYEESVGVKYKRIGSLKVDSDDYTQETTMTACEGQDKSWYYDATNLMLFIHFANFEPPLGKVIRLGIINGFIDSIDTTQGAYYDDIYYDPRLLSVSNLSKKKDSLFYGILQYQGGSASLINTDGYFEDIITDNELFGQPARVYLGFEGFAFSDFRNVYTGYIDGFSYDRNTFSLALVDNRKFFSRKIPVRTFNKTEFPSLDDNDVGSPKPLGYGPLRNIPCKCVNSADATAIDYYFYTYDPTDHDTGTLSEVRLNGIAVAGGSYSYDVATGIITIASGTFVSPPTEDDIYIEANLDGITCDINTTTIDHGMDIIKDLLYIYAAINYDTVNYNTTEWASETGASMQMGLYIDEEMTISEAIEKICMSEGGTFIVQDNGLFTMRHFSLSRAINRTIKRDEFLDEAKINYDGKSYLSSVVVNYSKDYAEDKYITYRNADYEQTSFKKYKKYAEKIYDTALATLADAEIKAEDIMIQSKDVSPTVTIKTKVQNIDLELMDLVTCNIARH